MDRKLKTRLRLNRYAGEQCCVCGKYGAHPPFGQPLAALIAFARENRLTIKLPSSEAVHPKCLMKLKKLVNWKSGTVVSHV